MECKVKVFVSIKKTIADPQGLTVLHALHSLGFQEVKEVRIGKYIRLKVEGDNMEMVKARIEEMCKKLLVNPIIEDYDILMEQLS